MKKVTLTFCALVAVASAALAGTEMYSGKEIKQVEQTPCPSWYADNEWNVGISFAYGFNIGDDDDNNLFFNNGNWDDGWGGAIDLKYFFRRYWGIGVQGIGLSVDRGDNAGRIFVNDDGDEFVGALLGTFTFRYPIPCSRFAPYFWVGAGGYFAGDDDDNFIPGANFRNNNNDGGFMGQFGGGFEVRFTPHIGWTNDISFNDVEGGDHDFILVRTGLNFAF